METKKNVNFNCNLPSLCNMGKFVSCQQCTSPLYNNRGICLTVKESAVLLNFYEMS